MLLLYSRILEASTKLPQQEVFGTAIKSLDLPGFMLTNPAVVMSLLCLYFGGTLHPRDSSVVIGLLVSSVVTFALFLV